MKPLVAGLTIYAITCGDRNCSAKSFSWLSGSPSILSHFLALDRTLIVDVLYQTLGFSLHRNPTSLEVQAHRHNEIEITVLKEGSTVYLFGGRQEVVPSGSLCVRWAAIPHICVSHSVPTEHYSLKIPLAWFLQWTLPKSFVDAVLGGQMILDREPVAGCSDWAMFDRWSEYLQADSPDGRRIVLLETEARLRRTAMRTPRTMSGEKPIISTSGTAGKIEKMAAFIVRHYTEPIRIADIAQAAGMHRNSASRLFRKSCGMTVLEFITSNRTWHAQHLLTTTDMKIHHIAHVSGFSSASRLYAAFQRIVGQLPKEYRDSMRLQQHYRNSARHLRE